MFYLCVLCICMHSRVFKMKCIKGMRKECTILCAFCVQYLHTTACQKCIQQVIRNANKMTTTGPRGSKAARIRNAHKSRKWAQSSILLPCKSDVHHWCLFPFFLVHLVGGTFQCFYIVMCRAFAHYSVRELPNVRPFGLKKEIPLQMVLFWVPSVVGFPSSGGSVPHFPNG